MNTYELVIVLEGNTTPAKKKAEISSMEKLVKILGGKVAEVEDWGVKNFSYPIKKNESGLFLIFTVELEGESAKELPMKLKLEEQILRHLIIRKDVAKLKEQNE